MIVYHFLSTFTRYLFEFDKSLLKGVHFPLGSTRFSPVFLTVKSHRLSQRFDYYFFFLYNCGISVFFFLDIKGSFPASTSAKKMAFG